MKATRFLMLSMLLTASPLVARAALIYGSIQVGDGPLAGHELSLSCGTVSHTTKTDERGSYNFKPAQQGKCDLSLRYDGQEPLTYTVYSQEKPARYDLEIVRGDDGLWTLRQK